MVRFSNFAREREKFFHELSVARVEKFVLMRTHEIFSRARSGSHRCADSIGRRRVRPIQKTSPTAAAWLFHYGSGRDERENLGCLWLCGAENAFAQDHSALFARKSRPGSVVLGFGRRAGHPRIGERIPRRANGKSSDSRQIPSRRHFRDG